MRYNIVDESPSMLTPIFPFNNTFIQILICYSNLYSKKIFHMLSRFWFSNENPLFYYKLF